MQTVTNNHNTLFTKKNETRFVDAFERLVDHIIKSELPQETKEWLAKVAAMGEIDAALPLDHANTRIVLLEQQLRDANARLSKRF